MITADQIAVHAVGDYILQSDWMATNKTKEHFPAFAHALIYSAPFMMFSPSLLAWAVIFGTHFLIDRYRLARYIVWAKNWIGPHTAVAIQKHEWRTAVQPSSGDWPMERMVVCKNCGGDYPGNPEEFPEAQYPCEVVGPINRPWAECSATGYPPDRPAWLAVWLLIFVDNILHIAINGAALRWL